MALRLQGLAMIPRVWSRRLPPTIPLSDTRFNLSRRGNSSGAAAWEESVEVETDHSLARRVEQAINEYRVRKAAPDWLPFLPGSSYWIPPERESAADNGEEIPVVRLELSDDELFALLAPSGWPSSSVSEKASSMEKKKNKNKKKT
ncbi:hypothetical protein O6H91_10G048300 [Diphasiastrum complanatum]|uniref:Uncharacterized protein n=1 Tax=Diphasiastrum complanatum TaxID=34168 RepID=A0ACC2CGM2_DIPCM|nr:hypothetical protein O6H91_10G048300 [Diphasiastrum complanatum]